MKAIKQYGWTVKIIGAALLITLAAVLHFTGGQDIIVTFIGSVIIIYAVIRLVPFVKTQNNDLIKTINIIEITIDVGIGIVLIVISSFTEIDLNEFFGYLLGVFFVLRGGVHFYGISEGAEKSDLPMYIFHILALVVGSFIFTSGTTPEELTLFILFFSILAGGYFSYDGYKGYKVYRYQKTLRMPKTVEKEDTDHKNIVPKKEEEEQIEDQIVS